ncbi:MAG: S41 family peptidase [Thermoanaerobaculaceae bacterium]
MVARPTPFARFTTADLANPGAFRWGHDALADPRRSRATPGKLVLLVDEITQSSAEYTAMAFRAAPGTLVIGSTTAAADGNISPIPLPGRLRTVFSGIGVFYPDKRPDPARRHRPRRRGQAHPRRHPRRQGRGPRRGPCAGSWRRE